MSDTMQKNDRMKLMPFAIPDLSSDNLYILLILGAKRYEILLMVTVCTYFNKTIQ
jgi:hypothetical protein